MWVLVKSCLVLVIQQPLESVSNFSLCLEMLRLRRNSIVTADIPRRCLTDLADSPSLWCLRSCVTESGILPCWQIEEEVRI